MPDHESSQIRSARSGRSEDGGKKTGKAERRYEEPATLVGH